ncbi:MAG: WXG100 family type VII secretion target [Pseudonocardiaceae bacterium]
MAAPPDTQAPAEEPVETVEFGLWWPAGDPGKLREAADAWDAMASHLDTATTTLSGAASAVTGANSGEAIDAFAAHWNLIGGPQGALPTIAGDCRNMATSLREFADAVDEVREQITQMAIEIAATVAIGVGLAFFTFGASAAAAGGTIAAMVARAAALASSLGVRAATIISRVAVMGTLGAAEGMAANTVAQLGSNAIFNDNHNPIDGFNLAEVGVSGAFGFAAGGAFGGFQAIRGLRARFGNATSSDYRATFFNAYPDAAGRVVVHHAVEQQVLKRYPNLVSRSQIHSLDNLRGVPKGSINNRVHLSEIRREWNRFYRENPSPSAQDLLNQATKIDNKYGHLFNPPIR